MTPAAYEALVNRAEEGPKPEPHIRRKATRLPRGSGFYLQRPANDPQQFTLCGAKATTDDLGWADAYRYRPGAPQWAWMDAHCAACREIVCAGGAS
jgi:hypothetical protein